MVSILQLATLLITACEVGAGSSPCRCITSSWHSVVALQQVGESRGEGIARLPGDCSCFDTARLRTETPRDELLGMGKVALNQHLHSCERNLDGLQAQKEYTVAASGAQIEKGKKTVDSMKRQLLDMKESLARERNSTLLEIDGMKKKISDLTQNHSDLKAAYSAEYADWYRVKNEVAHRTTTMERCQCLKAGKVFLQRQHEKRRHNKGSQQQLGTDPDVYDIIHNIEDCERKVREFSGQLEDADQSARHAAIADASTIQGLKTRIFDQQRLHRIMSRGSQLEALKQTEKAMLQTLEQQRRQIEDYVAAKDKLKALVSQLDDEMRSCGCS